MVPTAAEQVVRRLAHCARSISLIQFFGGEPALALDAIEAACTAARSLYDEGVLDELPSLRVATNLAALPSAFSELVRRFGLEVVVSCDGPQSLHDELRQLPDGRGSFAVVADNIARLQAVTDGREPRAIAATYTRLHQHAGMGPAELSSFLSERLGVPEVVISPAAATGPAQAEFAPEWSANREEHVEHARQALRGVARGDQRIDVTGLMMAPCIMFASQAACDRFCPAAVNSISVTPTGDIYPCHMFIGRDDFRMGNALRDEAIQDSRDYRRVWRVFRDNVKSENPKCEQCWLRLICRSCPGLMLKVNGAINRPVESDCMLKQGLTEGALLEIARIRQDPARWASFLANVQVIIRAARRIPAAVGVAANGEVPIAA